MSSFTMKSWKLLAPLALVGAVAVTACGDGDATVSARTADVRSAVGSDQHLENKANEIAERYESVAGSDQHLVNLSAQIAEPSEPATGGSTQNAWSAGEQAAADRLTGQAEALTDEYPGQFVPGTRHMPAS